MATGRITQNELSPALKQEIENKITFNELAGKITKNELDSSLQNEINSKLDKTGDIVNIINNIVPNPIDTDPNDDLRPFFLTAHENVQSEGTPHDYWYVMQIFYATSKAQIAIAYNGGNGDIKTRHYYEGTGWSKWSPSFQTLHNHTQQLAQHNQFMDGSTKKQLIFGVNSNLNCLTVDIADI